MIQIDLSRVQRDIKALQNASEELVEIAIGEETMTAVALNGITIIKRRTAEGRDADGNPFAPYTPEYEAQKVKKGRSSTPDLRGFSPKSNRMMENLHARYDGPGKATILFIDSRQANKAAGNAEKRDFMDIRLAAEVNALINDFGVRVNAILRKLGLA